MKEIKRLLLVILASGFFIGLFVICDRFAEDVRNEYSSQINPSLLKGDTGNRNSSTEISAQSLSVENMVIDLVSEGYSSSMTISAAGDILCQYTQLDMAYNSDTGTFDFSECFKYVKDLLGNSDYSIATLKTTLAGAYNGYTDDYGGYCASDGYNNSPESLAKEIKSAGIDLVNTATNHSLDSGAEGLKTTIDNLAAESLDHAGTSKASGNPKYKTINMDGISVAITGATNTLSVEQTSEEEPLINMLGQYDTKKVTSFCSEISQLKIDNEIVIVMLNFGEIDSTSIESEQRTLAEKIANAGADMIIGTGSRTMKPMEVITMTDDKGFTRYCPVFYGMGALLSSESYQSSSLDVDLSAILELNITRRGAASARIASVKITPIYSNWYEYQVQPVPVCEAKDTDKYKDVLDEDDMERIDYAYENMIKNILNGTDLSYEYKDYAYTVRIQ